MKRVSGVKESILVAPVGGLSTALIGGFAPVGILPTLALVKSAGDVTPPFVP